MALRDRIFFPQGVNMYVPGMVGSADLQMGQPSPFSLGAPAASSDAVAFAAASINCQAVATTEVAQALNWVSDSTYGRNLIFTISGDPGAASSVVDIFGWDYLGQPMVERFTVANGSTAIQYGKKAFYRVQKSKIVTASTNAVTAKVGTGMRLGLPYKGDIAWAKEDGIYVNLAKRDTTFTFDRAAATAVSGTSNWMRAPFPGFVKTLIGIPNGGGGATDPVITVELGGVAIVGLTVTVDTSDVAGLTVTDTPTTVGYNANNRFINNGLIEIVSAAAAGAFGDTLGIELTPTQALLGSVTDPQTVTGDDPRGTYECLQVLNGVRTVIVGLVGDSSVNAAGNGGLHGIRHVIA